MRLLAAALVSSMLACTTEPSLAVEAARSSAAPRDSTLEGAGLDLCAAQRLKGWISPQPLRSTVKVTYPFLFKKPAEAPPGGRSELASAVSRLVPKGVVAGITEEASHRVLVTGRARSHEDVARLMRAMAGIVSTPEGIGLVIERERPSTTVRVEFFDARPEPILDFGAADVSAFSAELLRADADASESGGQSIDFELRLSPK
jgi:hypothetical protein